MSKENGIHRSRNSCSSIFRPELLFPVLLLETIRRAGNSARFESRTFEHSNNPTSGGLKKERRRENCARVKSRGDQKGGDRHSTRRRWEVGQKSSDEPDLLRDYGVQGGGGRRWITASRLTGRRDGGEKKGDVRRMVRKDRFFSYLYFLCPFFLCRVTASLLLSLSIYIYTYILWDISSFNSGWRVDWYRSGKSNISIYIRWDSCAFWSMEHLRWR